MVAVLSSPPDPMVAAAADLARGSEVEDQLAVLAGQQHRLMAQIIELVAEVHRDGLCVGPDLPLPRWVGWQFGCEPATAARICAVAERAAELPAVVAAMAEGAVSLDQAAVIARRVRSEHEADAVDQARKRSPAQLRRWCQTLPPLHDEDPDLEPDPEPQAEPQAPGDVDVDAPEGDRRFMLPPPAEPRRRPRPERSHHWSLRYDDDGTGLLSAVLPPEIAAALDTAVRAQLDALWNEHKQHRMSQPGDELTGEPTVLDAVARLVDVAQAGEAAARPHSLRTRTIIHVDLDAEVGRFHLGPAIPASLLRYLTCDSTFRVLYEQHGIPMGIGRASQEIPDRTRIAVEHRDGGCRVPGCGRSHVQIHHVTHWTKGGVTETWNLIALCPHHHRMHHAGRLGISGADADDLDGIVFRNAAGKVIRDRPPPIEAERLPEPPPGAPYVRPEIGHIPNSYVQPPTGVTTPAGSDPTDLPCPDASRYRRDGHLSLVDDELD